MIHDPDEAIYLSRVQLAERAGISLRLLTSHEAANVGNLMAARERHKGLGLVYVASKCRKYLALNACRHRKTQPETQPVP